MEQKTFYIGTLEKLRELIVSHEKKPGRGGSIKAFAEAYGLSRQNLHEIFAGRQVMSLGLFIRITTALQLGDYPAGQFSSEALQMSLALYLEMQPPPVQALLRVALA